MKETSLPIWLISFYLILSLSLPTGLAIHMLLKSEMDALKGDEPNYLSHKMPKEKTAGVHKQLPFKLTDLQQGQMVVPRSFLSALPKNLPTEKDSKLKKRLFVKTMLPIILRANELIVEDRQKLVALDKSMESGTPLTDLQKRWIYPLLKKYRVLKDSSKPITHIHIEHLFDKMDVIPPSLALAQAAIESGWGTSYFAQNHQALFGQWTWNPSDKGVVPKSRAEGKTHRIRAFDYLLESVISYMTNLNRHNAYADLRSRRTELRDQNLPVTGPSLAPALDKYSEKGMVYVSDLLNIISYNKFHYYDDAVLKQSSKAMKLEATRTAALK